jgi:DNA-binding transcriptional LysR family regulator
VPEERWLARVAPDREIVFRSNSTTALAAAVRSDVGVAVLPCFVADPDPHLVRLDGPEPSGHELWLLVHGDLRRTPRVKAVIEWVDELVARGRKLLTGQG